MASMTITIAYTRSVELDSDTGLSTGKFKWTAASTVNGEALTGVATSKADAKDALLRMVELARESTASENVPVYAS